MTDDKNLKWMPGCQACNDGIVTEIKRLKGAGMGEREACRRMVLQQEAKYGAIIYDEEAIRSRYRFMTGKMRKRSKIDKPKPTTWQALARHFDDMPVLIEKVMGESPAPGLKPDMTALETIKMRAALVVTFLLRQDVDVRHIVDQYEGKI